MLRLSPFLLCSFVSRWYSEPELNRRYFPSGSGGKARLATSGVYPRCGFKKTLLREASQCLAKGVPLRSFFAPRIACVDATALIR
jgi:hypothetical protein